MSEYTPRKSGDILGHMREIRNLPDTVLPNIGGFENWVENRTKNYIKLTTAITHLQMTFRTQMGRLSVKLKLKLIHTRQ